MFAQPRSAPNAQQAVIQHVKNLPAASFDSRLPRVSLEYFLAYETGDELAKWTVTECEKQPKLNTAPPAPICVQADFDVNGQALVTVLVRTESSLNAQFRANTIVNITFTDQTGSSRRIKNLVDLPMELHRAQPRIPKELPTPARPGELARYFCLELVHA